MIDHYYIPKPPPILIPRKSAPVLIIENTSSEVSEESEKSVQMVEEENDYDDDDDGDDLQDYSLIAA